VTDFLDPHHLQTWLQSLGPWAAASFVVLQALQVIVFWIPGTPFEIAGGAAFGLGGGTLLSTLGLTLGNLGAFALARGLGKAWVERWLSAQDQDRWGPLVHHPRLDVVLGGLFFFPYLPKDIFSYLAGLSDLKTWRFVGVTTLARVPSLVLSSWVGDQAVHGMGSLLPATLAVGALVGPLLYLYRKPLLAALVKVG